MRNSLPCRSDVRFREEETSEPHLDMIQAIKDSNIVQLLQASGEVRDPLRDGHRCLNFVPQPMSRDSGFGEVAHQSAEMIRLFE